MINAALELISKNVAVEVVCSEKIDIQYSLSKKKNISLHVVNDPRSAVFYAFGLKTVSSKMPVLIVDSESESDIVTGLTESWFQKVGVWVFILNSQNLILNNFNSRNCVGEFIDLNENNLHAVLEQAYYDSHLPIIFNIKDKNIAFQSQFVVEEKHLAELTSVSGFLDVSDDIIFKSKLDCSNYRYVINKGCVSRYVGSLQTEKIDIKILMTTYEEAMQSINVFSLPYVNERFKLIILKLSGKNELVEWLESNNIEIFNGFSSLGIMINTNRPSVLFYEI